tara:strand:+ start:2562 stop:3677 length:1116 start_codon:yes stop_codon:yes gene_type:complete
MNASETVDLHRERYRITTDSPVAPFLVTVYNGIGGDQTHTLRTLEDLRGLVAFLRDDGAVRNLRCTYRYALDAGQLDSATVAQPYDVTDTLPVSGYSLARTLPATAENLRDPASRFLFIPHAHADSYGQDMLGKVNADCIIELETADSYADDGLGWIGDSLAVELDAEASPDVVDAIIGLETYPVVDDEALSAAEWAEDSESWEDWQRDDVAKALAEALKLSDLEAFTINVEKDSELDNELMTVASEQGRPSDESADDIAQRFIAAQSGLGWRAPTGTDWVQFQKDKKRLGATPAIAMLYDSGALRFAGDDEPVRATVPALSDELTNAQTLVEMIGDNVATIDDDDVRRVAEALARVAFNNDRTQPLPFKD